MVFRRDSKVDAFQRQISALRHQLGGESDALELFEQRQSSVQTLESPYRSGLPDLDAIQDDTPVKSIRESRDTTPQAPSFLPPSPPVPSIDMDTSVIAPSTSWNGNLESSGSLHVHGRVEGSLRARIDIFIGEEAEVDASVSAARVTVAGNFRGSIVCGERFEVLPRGRVSGEVRAPVIVVHEGALISGEVAMSLPKETLSSASAINNGRAARGGD